MSDFKDNFHREEEKKDLGYDDSAFLYFSLSLMTIFLVPYLYFLLQTFLKGGVSLTTGGVNCETSQFQELLRLKQIKARKTVWNRGFVTRVVFGALFSYVWFLNFQAVMEIEDLQQFDPYQILGVDTSSNDRTIRKQYRRLSLLVHPDKNPDNPTAVQEFIKLTKAYNILTDEVAKNNFLKYGNPDGQTGAYQVGIAMPHILLDKDIAVPFLIAAFSFLLIGVPGFLWFNYFESTNKDEGGIILIENKMMFGSEVNENLLLKHIPLILTKTIEFQTLIQKSKKEIELLRQLSNDPSIAEQMPQQVTKKGAQLNIKPLLLILGHMFQNPIINDPVFADSLDTIRKLTPPMLESMTRVCHEIQVLHQQGKSHKFIPAKTIEMFQVFSQYFIQGMWPGDNPLLQLPHFTQDTVKAYRKLMKEHKIANDSIQTFCRLSPQQRSDLQLLPQAQMDDIETLIRVLPAVEVSAKAGVIGSDQIMTGDLVTFEFRIRYPNLTEKEYPGYVHSLSYPYLKKQTWWIILSDKQSGRMMLSQKLIFRYGKNIEYRIEKKEQDLLAEPFNEEIVELRQQFKQVNKIDGIVSFVNDAYFGFEQTVPISFTVDENVGERGEVEEYDLETIEAIKGPNFVASLVSRKPQEESSSEDEAIENEEESLKEKLKQAGLVKALE